MAGSRHAGSGVTGLGYALQPGKTTVLGYPVPTASKGDQMRVANCLKRLGLRRAPLRRVNGKPRRVWSQRTCENAKGSTRV